ncbi:MAG: ABC transporter substrate-binding protein [Myxococcota bacterium]|nr:ABC transporter substrate-binding protein [Myxococcota bacterium]
MNARRLGVACALALAVACTNNPYPDEDATRQVLYSAFREAPRTLDPAVAYTTSSHAITGNVYDTLLEYHYLKRPYTLIPGLARAVPSAEPRPDGRVAYRFELRPGLIYQEDPSFELGAAGRRTRPVVAADVAFELMRIADPAVNSPVADPFSNLLGFAEFRARLTERRESDPAFAALPAHEQYAAVGGIEGVQVEGDHALTIELRGPYPQILYWFAMPFTTPVPWEAVAHYDGDAGRPRFADHPVGTGPYRLAHYDKQFRIVLEKNPNWYGVQHPEWRAPAAVYPSEGEPGDAEAGLLEAAGTPLPRIERIELRREKESIPTFNKFLQGYYDKSGIIKESFDRVVQNDRLSPEMAEAGVVLAKTVDPGVFYLGFNMEDETVGAPAGDRARLLRQAMSLAIDAEAWTALFLNGRGVPAQSPLPPGLFGFEADYRNPFRQVDLERARALLAEAGYPGGIDPDTGRPLHLTFDTYQTTSQQMLQNQFYVDAWREIGIDVEIAATNYNQFQEKVRNGAYQLFAWGWIADYPDPENFLFLLTCDMRRSQGGGPNTANFCDERYEELFARMRTRENDPERLALIRAMRDLLELERPWIELFHPEAYVLYHGWLEHVKPFGMSFPMVKYQGLDVEQRAARRVAWNRPVRWPAYALGLGAVVLLIPGVVTFLRERQ